MATLTTALIRDAKPRAKMYELTCSGLPGFLLRILPTGKKVFLVRHRIDGRDHRTRLGLWSPTLTVEEARRRAAVILGGGEVGVPANPPVSRPIEQVRAPNVTRMKRAEIIDPRVTTPEACAIQDLEADEDGPEDNAADTAVAPTPPDLSAYRAARRPANTIAALAERFLREYVDVYLKRRTAWNYHHYMVKFILPRFGKRDFRQVSRSDVQALHTSMKDNKAAADYVLCVLGSLYTRIIEEWELANIRNPVDGARRYGSREVERFLTPAERRNLQVVLETGLRLRPGTRGHVEAMTVWALQLLALTGLRRDEVLGLKWSMVDWQHALFNLPDTKTGQRSVRVSSPVMEVLREIRQRAGCARNGYVITSRTGGRLGSLNRSWERIRVAAGIPDVRLHDLRHSFASDAIMGGVPLAVVGKLLGHRQARTTERYAHIADKVVQDAVEHTAARIADAAKPALIAPPAPPPFKVLTNSQWTKMAPIVCAGRSARTQAHLRKTVEGIRWVLHHHASWRELPREYGSYTSCWRWHSRWQADGTWMSITAVLHEPVRILAASS